MDIEVYEMTDWYDVELWNAEGTKCKSDTVNGTDVSLLLRDFKTFNTYSSMSIIKKPKPTGRRRKGRKTELGTPPTDLNERKYHEEGVVCNESFTGDPVVVDSADCESCFIQLGQDDTTITCKKTRN